MNTPLMQTTPVSLAGNQAASRPARRQSFVLPFVLAFAFLGFGLILVLVSGFSIRDGLASSSWYHAQGTVLSAQVDVDEKTDSDHRTTYTYTPSISYQYSVDGKTFTSRQVQFSSSQYNSEGSAERIVNQFPADSDVTVYYSPDDHARSVLIPGVVGNSFIGLGVGVLFAAIGVGLLVVIVKYLAGRRTHAHAAAA